MCNNHSLTCTENNIILTHNRGHTNSVMLSDFNNYCPPGGQPTGHHKTLFIGERSSSVVERLTQDRGAAGSSLTKVSTLCS